MIKTGVVISKQVFWQWTAVELSIMEDLNGAIIMKKGCHNYADMHDLVTATDDVKSLFVLTLGKLVCVKDSTNNI